MSAAPSLQEEMRLHTRDMRALLNPTRAPRTRMPRMGPSDWVVPGLDQPLHVHQEAATVRAEMMDLLYLAAHKKKRRRDIHFQGSPPQLAFWRSTARIQGFVGGIGSGKTYSGAIKCLSMPPRTTILVCAPTYVMLRDGAWRTFWDVCAPYVKKHNQQRFETTLTNGTTLVWRATLFPDRLRGINAGAIWIDEAGYVSDAAWKVALGRLRREPGILWLTSTPKGKKHWMYDLLVAKRDRHTEMFHSPTSENTFLPDAYLELTAKNYGGTYKLQELGGEFVDFGGTKFKREWFNLISDGGYPQHPDREVRFWDLAVTAESRPGQKKRAQKDATASLMGCFHDGILYLRWGIHMKEEWPTVRRRIVHTAILERGVEVGVEAYGGGWKGLVQDLKALPELLHTDIDGIALPGDKAVRAARWSHLAEDGRVCLVQGPWTDTFLDEVEVFGQDDDGAPPDKKVNDDFIDAASGVVGMLEGGSRSWLARLTGPFVT